MNRKKFLQILALATLFVIVSLLAYQNPYGRSALAAPSSPVGTWKVTIQPDPASGAPGFVNYSTVTSEGLIVNADNLGVVGLGVWEKSGKNQYAVTFRELFLENGQQRIAKIRSTIKLSSDKESFSGPFTTEIFDQDENLLFSASGMVSAVRVHVEPLP